MGILCLVEIVLMLYSVFSAINYSVFISCPGNKILQESGEDNLRIISCFAETLNCIPPPVSLCLVTDISQDNALFASHYFCLFVLNVFILIFNRISLWHSLSPFIWGDPVVGSHWYP